MRFLVIVTLALAACTDGALGTPGGGVVLDLSSHDHAGGGTDLPLVFDLSPKDIDAGGTKGCLQIITCAQGCGVTASCVQSCVAMGTPMGQLLYQALSQCAFSHCTIAADGGAPACGSIADFSAGCISCVTAAAQSASCDSQLTACVSG